MKKKLNLVFRGLADGEFLKIDFETSTGVMP